MKFGLEMLAEAGINLKDYSEPKTERVGENRRRIVLEHLNKNIRIIVKDPARYPNMFEIAYKKQ